MLSDPDFGFDDGMEEILSERDTGTNNYSFIPKKPAAAAQKVRVQKGTKN
jgi:hypothetical protein